MKTEYRMPQLEMRWGGSACSIVDENAPMLAKRDRYGRLTAGIPREDSGYFENIVRAVNSHDDLVNAVADLRMRLRKRECSIADCASLDNADAALHKATAP